MRIAVCDDENCFVNLIESYIDRLSKAFKSLDCDAFYYGEELLKQYEIENSPYDIILLDMEMPGMNGIETAKRLRELDEKAIIIYITNHKEYVYESFEAAPFRFIVKPVSFVDFEYVFGLAYNKVLKNSKPFYFGVKGTSVRLYCEDIVYFESDKRLIIIHTKDKRYEFYGKLDNVFKELEGFDFAYVHKSFVVNMNYIKEVNYGSLILRNGTAISISESRRKDVHKEYLNFLTRSYKLS